MNKTWLLGIFITSFTLFGVLKSYQVNHLRHFVSPRPALKIIKFNEAKQGRSLEDQELIALWESILTGRSAPLSRPMKKIYRELALSHVFTPSGFHLTTALAPFFKLLSSTKQHLFILLGIGLILSFLPGFVALKRMVMIKFVQRTTSLKTGFVLALLLDVLFGGFQASPLSFSYSFLFLGIIYSGARRVRLIFWFFSAQIFLAYFNGGLVSPLLLLWSPFLNLTFGLIMPFLLLLAFPFWTWQIEIGLFLLEMAQKLVLLASQSLNYFPLWEVHLGTLILFALFTFKKWRFLALGLLLISGTLNMGPFKNPPQGSYDFYPRGDVIQVKKETFYFIDGTCRRDLLHGYWWETCRPRKPSKKITAHTLKARVKSESPDLFK